LLKNDQSSSVAGRRVGEGAGEVARGVNDEAGHVGNLVVPLGPVCTAARHHAAAVRAAAARMAAATNSVEVGEGGLGVGDTLVGEILAFGRLAFGG